MANLLYLVHRLPYPPNKGDKVRSYHLLQHLRRRHRVFLGTFVDDPDDEAHLPAVRMLCDELCAITLHPHANKLRSLSGLAQGLPLTVSYYDHPRMRAWVRQTIASRDIDAIVVFSSGMAQYAAEHDGLALLVDLVDVDSAKWTEYSRSRAWPFSWLYRREGDRLLDYEKRVAERADRTVLVSRREVELFETLAPECAGTVKPLGNGVDSEHFSPDRQRPSPFEAGERPLVFTGAMDYWPNADAVTWFATEMMPTLRERWPALRFHIVGRDPTAPVRALASDAVSVSGTVPDVRPYLQHAAVVVAPLRLARGIQNKVLEAMAMGRPVVCAAPCADAIGALSGTHLLAAEEPADYIAAIERVLSEPSFSASLGTAGSRFMRERFSWHAQLADWDEMLDAAIASHRATQSHIA